MKIALHFKKNWRKYTVVLSVCLIIGLLLLAVMAAFSKL